jgi:hypothetical protein
MLRTSLHVTQAWSGRKPCWSISQKRRKNSMDSTYVAGEHWIPWYVVSHRSDGKLLELYPPIRIWDKRSIELDVELIAAFERKSASCCSFTDTEELAPHKLAGPPQPCRNSYRSRSSASLGTAPGQSSRTRCTWSVSRHTWIDQWCTHDVTTHKWFIFHKDEGHANICKEKQLNGSLTLKIGRCILHLIVCNRCIKQRTM